MRWTKEQLVAGILSGNKALLSKSITFSESTKASHRQLADQVLDEIQNHTGHSIRIGITGVPGVGKSTFIESFGCHLIDKGYKVAVLAIDPSSSVTHGSILGDKTRMEQLSTRPEAFIRPTASGNTLGGLAANTQDAIALCEAAGYNIIIVETVGVGQSETEVYHITDFFLLLMLAGAGDELQGIKRGIIEMCDGMVINKADGENMQKANQARIQYAKALHFFPQSESGWTPKVLTSSALERTGIAEVWNMIKEFTSHQKSNYFFDIKRNRQALRAFENGMHGMLLALASRNKSFQEAINNIRNEIDQGKLRPSHGIRKLEQHLSLHWQ